MAFRKMNKNDVQDNVKDDVKFDYDETAQWNKAAENAKDDTVSTPVTEATVDPFADLMKVVELSSEKRGISNRPDDLSEDKISPSIKGLVEKCWEEAIPSFTLPVQSEDQANNVRLHAANAARYYKKARITATSRFQKDAAGVINAVKVTVGKRRGAKSSAE